MELSIALQQWDCKEEAKVFLCAKTQEEWVRTEEGRGYG